MQTHLVLIISNFQIFGHISGAHVNPVTTVGAAIMQKITLDQVPFYVIPQLLGGCVGYGFVMVRIVYRIINKEIQR